MRVPKDLEELIKEIVAYEEMMKKEEELDESGLEYLYDYVDDYSDYPEECDYDVNDSPTVIKIDM